MVQVIEQLGGVAGRLGKGFAQGLSDQLPKEIERQRLSSGLKGLAEKDFKGKNQLETLADIYAIPGITPEIANLAQQQIMKQNFLDRQQGQAGQGGQQAQGIQGNQPAVSQASQTAKPPQQLGNPEQFATPAEIKQYKQSLLKPITFEETNELAKKYLEQGITQDPNQATALAQNELTQNRQAQKQRISDFRNGLNESLGLTLQGAGLGDFKDVSGEIQKALIDQGEYLVSQGTTPEAASDYLNQIGLDLGKTVNKLKDTGSFSNMFRSASTKVTELKAQRKKFEDYGFTEQFDDLAASALGITPLQTAHVLDPIKNKAIENDLSQLKKYSGVTNKKIKESDLDNLIRNIRPKDNLFSIEYELRDKGYDVNQFKKRVEELVDSKEIPPLTPQQSRQQQRPVSGYFLGDILFRAFGGR